MSFLTIPYKNFKNSQLQLWKSLLTVLTSLINNSDYPYRQSWIFTAALALRSRGLVIGSREEKEEKEEKEREEKEREEEKNLQIAIRCLWDLFN